MKTLLFLFLTLSLNEDLFSQPLHLSDLLEAYHMDSLQLRQFAEDKRFTYVKLKEDQWMVTHTYNSIQDDKVSFRKMFSKGMIGSTLEYQFDSRKEYKTFIDSLKAASFVFERDKEPFTNDSRSYQYREMFVGETLRAELSSVNYGTGRYILRLYPKSFIRKYRRKPVS